MKEQRGITLIALVVTIIILIIIAGVSINATISENGIITKGAESKFKTEVQQIAEEVRVNILEKKIENNNLDECNVKGNICDWLKDKNKYNSYIEKLYIENGDIVYIGDIEREKRWAEEIGLTVIDMTIENKLAMRIAGTKSEAVEKNQITKNQYTYKIEGELKTRIEEKLGRNIDYSIDRFYEVKYKNIFPDMEEGKTYIYNDNTGIVVEVKEKTQKNIATWFWKNSSELDIAIMEQENVQNEFFEKLENYKISQIYIFQPTEQLVGNKQIENFVANAYSRNIKSYIVVGETDYLDSYIRDKSIYDAYDALEDYNKSVEYNKRIAGISYDAEFWVNPDYDWKNNNSIRREHIKYIKDTNEYAKAKNLEAIFTLPFWIVQFDYIDNNANTINMYDEITKMLEEVNLMIYRDNAENIDNLVSNVQENAVKTIYEYNEKNSCTLNIAVEVDQTTEGDNITFYEEELDTKGYLMGEFSKLENLYNNKWQNYTFSIHHTKPLIELSGGIQIEDVVKIGNAQQLIQFLSRIDDSNGKKFEISADIDMSGYTVEPYKNLEKGFNGILDGKNHTIENLNIQGPEYIGLFGMIGQDGIVKNLNIKNSEITSTGYFAGAISGVNHGKIINCSNQNTVVTAKYYVGGITGRNYGIIENAFNTGEITSQYYYVGGIAGRNENNAKIYNVYNVGMVNEQGEDGSKGAIAGENVGIVQKAYWLDSTSEDALGYRTEGETIKMLIEEMKANNFVDILNMNILGNSELEQWKIDLNGEYPHF